MARQWVYVVACGIILTVGCGSRCPPIDPQEGTFEISDAGDPALIGGTLTISEDVTSPGNFVFEFVYEDDGQTVAVSYRWPFVPR
jgi:hypothetical protein